MNDTLLDVNNLSVEFKSKKDSFTAVDDISFSIEKGKTLSLVGIWVWKISNSSFYFAIIAKWLIKSQYKLIN